MYGFVMEPCSHKPGVPMPATAPGHAGGLCNRDRWASSAATSTCAAGRAIVGVRKTGNAQWQEPMGVSCPIKPMSDLQDIERLWQHQRRVQQLCVLKSSFSQDLER